MMTDAKMLELLRKDPNNGLKVLMDRYAGLIYATVKHILADYDYISSDVEDIVSDSFSEFYLNLDGYHLEKSSLKNYLCCIAKNKSIDFVRKKKTQGAKVDIDDEDFEIQIPDGTQVEDSVLKKEFLQEAFSAIDSLGDPDSSIIFRKYYCGEPSEEIALRLNLTVSVVNTRTHRALKKLRDLLGGKNNEE